MKQKYHYFLMALPCTKENANEKICSDFELNESTTIKLLPLYLITLSFLAITLIPTNALAKNSNQWINSEISCGQESSYSINELLPESICRAKVLKEIKQESRTELVDISLGLNALYTLNFPKTETFKNLVWNVKSDKFQLDLFVKDKLYKKII